MPCCAAFSRLPCHANSRALPPPPPCPAAPNGQQAKNRSGTLMPVRGLYALTPDGSDDSTLLAQVAAAVAGGLRLLQYRNKSASAACRWRQAALLAAYCRDHNVCFIVNDDIALARQCAASGVHLGSDDMPIAAAKRQLGSDAIIGSTCKNSLAAARRSAAAGADYIAMGAVYPSASKPSAAHCPLATLSQAKQQLALPLVAIGGITTANAAATIRAGADAIAVIHGLFAADDITATARTFCQLFDHDR